MKKIYTYGVLFFLMLLGTSSVQAQEEPSETINPYGTIRTLIGSIQKLSSLYQEQKEEEITLQFEENFDFPSKKKREKLLEENGARTQEYEQLQTEIALEKTTLENKKETLESMKNNEESLEEGKTAIEIEKEIVLLEQRIMDLGNQAFEIEQQKKETQNEIEELEKIYEERKKEQRENIQDSKEKLLQLEESIAKQKILVKNQWYRFFYDILLLLGIVASLLLVRYIVKIIIDRVSVNLTQKRKYILFNLNRIFFNIIIILVVTGIVFSQIINLLPFIAILSTGIAFAVRDSIACFIGWFVIGSDRGFKVGHIIKAGELFGEVKEIGPILTRVHEMQGREKTGKFVSMPNKFIFEKEVINLSQNYNITQESVIFLLEPESDIQKAQELLTRVLQQANRINEESKKKYGKRIEKNAIIDEDDMNDHVLLQQTAKGPELQAKFFASFENINRVQETITKNFIQAVRKEENISIKYIDY